MSDQNDRPEGWHADKRVPLATIFVLVVQLVGFGVVYGKLENRVTNMEARFNQSEDSFRQVPERLARVEALLELLIRRLDERQDGSR